MKPTILHLLVHLSKTKGLSTTSLSKEMQVSQQTVSRWLRQLLKEKLVEKTKEGYSTSQQGLSLLNELFGGKAFHGTVFTGLGEGKYYLSRKGYLKEFARLGLKPFPGTLNLRLSSQSEISANKSLRSSENCFFIKEFNEEGRTFGAVKCFPALIQGKIHGQLIYPVRAHYPEDVIELIAEKDLRKTLNLKDGSAVKVELYY